MKKSDFLHVDTTSLRLKVDQKILVFGRVRNGCAHSGCRNLKLAGSYKEINGINWFLVFWYKFRKV